MGTNAGGMSGGSGLPPDLIQKKEKKGFRICEYGFKHICEINLFCLSPLHDAPKL